MRTMSGGPCLHYDCSNRNSFGYCKTTMCINEHYQQEQWGLPSIDSIRVEEAYNWHDDVMEITSRIVNETNEARLSNIANHFEVDLSEIRSFLEMKQKPQTNADGVRAMTDEELAEKFADGCCRDLPCEDKYLMPDGLNCYGCWLDWLKKEVE